MNAEPIRKSVRVKAARERAFTVFTRYMDSWWPRTHHIGKAPLRRAVVEERVGGRCYSEHMDGSESDWGQVLAWEPPERLVFSWQVTAAYRHEPDLAKSSEVEVRFTQLDAGTTQVDLEHRHFERHGSDVAAAMRETFDQPTAWSGMLELFRGQVETNQQ